MTEQGGICWKVLSSTITETVMAAEIYSELYQDELSETVDSLQIHHKKKATGVFRQIYQLSTQITSILVGMVRYFWDNKPGIFGLFCIGITIVIISFNLNSYSLSLTESKIYDYIFKSCKIKDEDSMCPTYNLNHTMYFQYEGVYILPYVENGILKDNVFFRYDFCKEIAIPKYPSNYQRHCNLMSAGIGTQITLICGYTLSLLTFFHTIIILFGYFKWNIYHKLNWIFALISSLCYFSSVIIWYIMGYIDITSNEKLYSESFGGMKIETKHGYGIILILISAFISIIGTFCLKYYIWTMKIEDFKYKYDESETSLD